MTRRASLSAKTEYYRLACSREWSGFQIDVDEIFVIEDESVALVQVACVAASKDVKTVRSPVIAFRHDLGQNFAPNTLSLMCWREVEVF